MKLQLLTTTKWAGPEHIRDEKSARVTTFMRRHFYGSVPHLGAGIIARELEKLEVKYDISDINDPRAVEKGKKADLVGISGKMLHGERIVKLANELIKNNVMVIAGGPGPSLFPERLLERAPGISVVVGESEGLWEEIINDAETNRMKPIYQRERPLDLRREYTLPDRNLPMFKFSFKNPASITAPIELGRGCHNS
ncbi:MAG: cobalamin B12-binding domain-containing protein, partial [Candidatus Micrarchaeota archaeon]